MRRVRVALAQVNPTVGAIEANARLLWADLGENDKGAGVGARFYLMSRLSIGARYDRLGDDDVISAGLRFEL